MAGAEISFPVLSESSFPNFSYLCPASRLILAMVQRSSLGLLAGYTGAPISEVSGILQKLEARVGEEELQILSRYDSLDEVCEDWRKNEKRKMLLYHVPAWHTMRK